MRHTNALVRRHSSFLGRDEISRTSFTHSHSSRCFVQVDWTRLALAVVFLLSSVAHHCKRHSPCNQGCSNFRIRSTYASSSLLVNQQLPMKLWRNLEGSQGKHRRESPSGTTRLDRPRTIHSCSCTDCLADRSL